ncbi:MAG: methyltransferase domain-containing protein [Candidatus Woesearchaeota archaeon]
MEQTQMKKILEMGPGKSPYKAKIGEQVITIDKVRLPGIDIVHDLNKSPWPFKENEFDEVLCFMILEHLDDFIKAVEEIWRISKQGGIVRVTVPFFPSMYAASDPTHKNFFTYFSFDCFTQNHTFDYYSKAKFNIKKRYIRFSWNKILNILSTVINIMPTAYSRYFAGILPSNEIYFELEVVKGG